MPKRKPPHRTIEERHSNNEKRRLREPVPNEGFRELLAASVRFEGSGKHKVRPRAFRLEPAPSSEDDTYCDGHADFAPHDMARVPSLLQRGIQAGLIGHHDKHGDPTLVWMVDDNGWIYEGRITIPGQSLYHGYPVLPSDPVGLMVIARYEQWVYDQNDRELNQSLQNAREKYR